jgi:tRNA(His) 5'-end guanylyltransferase
MSVGIWPIVFVTTDLINEYFGERGVKSYPNNRLSYAYTYFVIIYAASNSSRCRRRSRI